MGFEYDVFLSHNENDKPAVERLARKLEKKGLTLWLDDWHLVPGQPRQEGIEEALDNCATYAVFIGPSGVSGWHNEQMRSALEERVQNQERRVIPVLLPGAPELIIPRFLKRVSWVDFRVGLDDKGALHRLVCGIKGIAPGSVAEKITKAPSLDDIPPPPADLPTGSHVPFLPNYLFAGRVRELNLLAAALLPQVVQGLASPQVVTGMGGLGKTQLAVEFAHRYGQLFRGVHWLGLADISLLDSEIAFNGEKMGLPNWPADQPSQVSYTLQQWKENGPRLIVLDNFEDMEQAPEILARFRHSNLRVLITSRRADWPPSTGVETLTLGFLNAQDSLKFLKLSLKQRKDSDADLLRLAERFGYLPLAMELGERYMAKQPRLSIDDYLTQLEKPLDHESMKEWRKDLPNPTKHDIDLFGTIRSSWNALPDDTPRLLLILAGYLAPNQSIPLEIFENYLGMTSQECDANLEILYGFGLLRQNEDGLPYIHPLVAEFAHQAYRSIAKSQGEESEDISNDIVRRLANLLFTVSNNILESYFPKTLVHYYPHLKLVAIQAEGVNFDFAGVLWNNCGAFLSLLGDVQGAQTAYEHALVVNEKFLGPNHPHVAESTNNLAVLHKDRGNYLKARDLLKAAIQIAEAQPKPDEKEIANYLSNLAAVYFSLHEYATAKETYARALQIKEGIYPQNNAAFATDFNGLGAIELKNGNINEAHMFFSRALQIQEGSLRTDHPDIANTLVTLGVALNTMKDFHGAQNVLERAVMIYESAYGLENHDVARTVTQLGATYLNLNKIAEAKSAFERALKIDEKIFGIDSFNTAAILNSLGVAANLLGDKQTAIAYLERAIKIVQNAETVDQEALALYRRNLEFVNKR